MKKTKPTAGQRMIASAKEALAFAKGRQNHGYEVHIPNNIDVKAIRERISLSQGEFAKLFGLSKRTLSAAQRSGVGICRTCRNDD